jgi:S-adenosylmethionine:tRNA ribosyltransferase-isomerase
MKTSLFDFDLAESLIANAPVSPRDASRLLVVADELQDKIVRELPQFLRAGDIMVFNDTKVIPARLYGKRGEARIEILLHKKSGPQSWQCFARPGKKLRVGDTIIFGDDFSARVFAKHYDGQVVLEFNASGEAFHAALNRHGQMPLPPYIERDANDRDAHTYQTIYAANEGAVAAPTAGLHFTPELMAAIDALGVERAQVTLHVGGGTFLPVKVDDTDAHVMHSEYAQLSADTAQRINEARKAGGRVIAVGTTSLRTLESAADASGQLQKFDGETAIFITPGYQFKAVDVLMTNFHLPRSTLFMLVSAFCGLGRMQAAYQHAIDKSYRFYSYGDACLLFRSE